MIPKEDPITLEVSKFTRIKSKTAAPTKTDIWPRQAPEPNPRYPENPKREPANPAELWPNACGSPLKVDSLLGISYPTFFVAGCLMCCRMLHFRIHEVWHCMVSTLGHFPAAPTARALLVWVSAARRESTTEERTGVFSRDKNKGAYSSEEGGVTPGPSYV